MTSTVGAESPRPETESLPRINLWVWGLRAFGLLVLWLMLFGLTEKLPSAYQLVSVIGWIIAFIWLYLLPGRPAQPGETKQATFRNLGSAIPAGVLPSLALLIIVLMVFEPWWQALFTAGCANPQWGGSLWPRTPLPGSNELPLIGAIALLLCRTAVYPLAEESAMRGWLLMPLTSRLGGTRAVLVTSALFSLLHLQLSFFLAGYFLLGVLLGCAVLATGSLWSSIALHFAWNFGGALLMHVGSFNNRIVQAFESSWFRCGPSALMVILSFAICLALIRRAGQNRAGRGRDVL